MLKIKSRVNKSENKLTAGTWRPLSYDGVSLLLRGVIGALFLFHESSSLVFKLIFISHLYIGGILYAYLGYGLLVNNSWTTKMPGYVLAISSVIWAIPRLGADFFYCGLRDFISITGYFFTSKMNSKTVNLLKWLW